MINCTENGILQIFVLQMDHANFYIMYLLILSVEWWQNYNFESDFSN